ncbi:MAG: hypothetical protein IAI50_10530 [Candidatus Eremiobacteraeota bacterium]|nr:hypothetical protein [Candidatus Eremiobacteraeota bacterium]
MKSPLLAGAVGAVTTNLLHEIVRRSVPDAPRVDLLGMQALSKLVATQTEPPKGRNLYFLTLAGDLLSNAVYFSLIGIGPRAHAVKLGMFVGTLAGIGAVVLPGPLGLSETPTSRTRKTEMLTVALYAAGGLATGIALRPSATP